jgi:hypothetical protein
MSAFIIETADPLPCQELLPAIAVHVAGEGRCNSPRHAVCVSGSVGGVGESVLQATVDLRHHVVRDVRHRFVQKSLGRMGRCTPLLASGLDFQPATRA